MLRPRGPTNAPQLSASLGGGGPGCALLAGSITSIKPGAFQIGTREDRAQRPCRSPAALQGLSGIGIPNRKTPARHIGPRCSILRPRHSLVRARYMLRDLGTENVK